MAKKPAKKTRPKSRPKRLYVTINGKKNYLDETIVKKYQLKAGLFLPYTNHEVFIEK